MAARQFDAAMLPKLDLTRGEQEAIQLEARAVIDRALVLEAEFRRRGGAINQKKWKEVMARDNFHVYKRRKSSRHGKFVLDDEIKLPELMSMRAHDDVSRRAWFQSFTNETDSTTSSRESVDDIEAPPIITCAGYVEGKLEDVIYGAYDGNEAEWKLRSAYLKDKLSEARILATIEGPTHEDPCRFLGIKWFSTEYPPGLGVFISKRDSLVIEAIGITTDSQGERHGYLVVHDYYDPRIPELTDYGIIRNKLSVCFLSRQVTPDRVAIYGCAFLDLGGNLPSSVAISIGALTLVSTANTVDASYNKKLVWLMNQQQAQRRMTKDQLALPRVSSCHSCHKIPRLRGLTPCCACAREFCSACAVERRLVVDAPTDHRDVTWRNLKFCFACILRAKELPAVHVARVTNKA
ncbi:hypothetical protein Poli38472_012595 [Pythium oligandrum]|uniref:FYVE-type domain-containing protein n=1 Tax=Pythium oligandrum TaxID=41045 RepID=A0A8K1CDG9_PYTOL|nr:hypothetical protein Poli38472_012595 [Pythium oligandrum]|eukprot:TMW61404.1 hypothetical protein Poli38472_012595 [Pythium oligandrum]